MQDMDPRVGDRELVGDLAGTVRTGVVSDQQVRFRHGLQHSSDDRLDVVAFVVGRDDDEYAPEIVRRTCHWPTDSRSLTLLISSPSDVGCCSPARRRAACADPIDQHSASTATPVRTYSGIAPSRLASVVAVRSGTSATKIPGVYSAPVRW